MDLPEEPSPPTAVLRAEGAVSGGWLPARKTRRDPSVIHLLPRFLSDTRPGGWRPRNPIKARQPTSWQREPRGCGTWRLPGEKGDKPPGACSGSPGSGVPPSPTAAPRPSGSPSAKARPLSAARSSGLCPDRSGSRPRCSRLSRRPPGQDAPAHPVTSPDSRRGRARSDHLPSTLPADRAALALLSSARGPRPGRTDPGCPRKRPLTAGAVPPSPCMSLQSSPTSLPPVSPRGGAG